MLDTAIKLVFYGASCIALFVATFWLLRSAWETIRGTGEIVIAPFEIVRADGEVSKAKGTTLAHMLQARLREISQDIDSSQAALMSEPRPTAAAKMTSLDRGKPIGAGPVAASAPRLFTQRVGLEAGLLEQTDFNVSVGGVEFGGMISWLQRRLANNRTLVFTVYEGQRSTQVSGSLQALRLKQEAFRIELEPESGEASVPLDRVVEKTAYEVIRRRVAEAERNRAEILSGDEFQSLVEVLKDLAVQNRRVELGRPALDEFKRLLDKVTPLAHEVPEWFELNYLTAQIAESARDWKAANMFYDEARRSSDPLAADVLKDIDGALARVQAEAAALIVAAAPVAGEEASAKAKIEAEVQLANEILNDLLGQSLEVPPVQLQKDPELMTSSYFDGTSIVAPPMVQYLPDFAHRETAWPHVIAITGSDLFTPDEGPGAAILYSTVDILTMIVQQQVMNQDEKSSAWVLAPGAVEWFKGLDLSKVESRTPWVSFRAPGTAYDDPEIGKDRQAAHMRDYDTKGELFNRKFVNNGILNKAFYEIATRTSTRQATTIWITALGKLRRLRRIDFPRFAQILYESAGASQDAVREALAVVGLNVTPAK